MTWMLRSRVLVGTTAAVALLALAGCGGSSSSASTGKVASLSGSGSTTTTSGGNSTKSFETQILAYTKCLRAHGLNVPDPQFDANGRPQFNSNATNRGRRGGLFGTLDSKDPKVQAARQACQSLQPRGGGGFQDLTPAQLAQRQKDLLAFAKCMRDNGVNFPDPTFDANGRPQFGNGQGNGAFRIFRNQNDPKTQKAFQTCQAKLGNSFRFRGGPGGQGGPGGTGGGASSGT